MRFTSQLKIVSLCVLLLGSFSCTQSVSFPTGVNGVAILESGGGNVYPPPPVTHDPLAGAIITIQGASDGQVMATQVADEHGGFRIELAPGTYQLSAQAPPDRAFILAPAQQTVVIVPHELTQVVVTFASVSHWFPTHN